MITGHADTPPPSEPIPYDPNLPCTHALQRALAGLRDPRLADDLRFLERWEMCPLPGSASALRMVQIRRANPALAAEIRAELDLARRSGARSAA